MWPNKAKTETICVLLGSAVVVCLFFLQQFVISNDMHHNPGNSDILVHRKKEQIPIIGYFGVFKEYL